MKIFVCVDEYFGMSFAGRRQSRDKHLLEYITQKCQGTKLWLNLYSSIIFDLYKIKLSIDENFLEMAETGDFCFVENFNLADYEDKIEIIYLCKWNRNYPSDFYFNIDLEKNFKLINTDEISGYSHEIITVEKWTK